jgi:hypothetical protein
VIIVMLTPEQAKALYGDAIAQGSSVLSNQEARYLLFKAIEQYDKRLCPACGARKP